MHHVCLDRFFDIGLILPNDSYVEPMAAMSATYTIAVYSIQDADSRKKIPRWLTACSKLT